MRQLNVHFPSPIAHFVTTANVETTPVLEKEIQLD
jgi:hypothetical protein